MLQEQLNSRKRKCNPHCLQPDLIQQLLQFMGVTDSEADESREWFVDAQAYPLASNTSGDS